MANSNTLNVSKDDHGYFKTLGYQLNERAERVPRKFRLGYDRYQAIRKLKALHEAWDDLDGERGTKVWTDAAIKAALDSDETSPEMLADANLSAATPVVPPRPPRVAAPLPATNCMSLSSALDEFAAFMTARNDVSDIHRRATRSRIDSIKMHLSVNGVSETDCRMLDSIPVCEIDGEKLTSIRNMITSRPITHHQRQNRKSISIDTTKNWLMVLGMAFDWFEITPRMGWTPPHHRWREQFTLTKKQAYAFEAPDERDNDGKPKAPYTVDELVAIYKNASKLGRLYLLMGLTLGLGAGRHLLVPPTPFRRDQWRILHRPPQGQDRGRRVLVVCPELAAKITGGDGLDGGQ